MIKKLFIYLTNKLDVKIYESESESQTQDWDIIVLNKKAYWHVLLKGSLGLGESRIWGWVKIKEPGELYRRLALINPLFNSPYDYWKRLTGFLFNQQNLRRADKVRRVHYDNYDEFLDAIVGEYWLYSCADWYEADNLDEAQANKLKRICETLKLKPGMTLLDVGCGSGEFLRYAVKNYKVKGAGVNSSVAQIKRAKKLCQGVDVDFYNTDWRLMPRQKFDAIASIGHFEAIGHKNFRRYMKFFHDRINDDGIVYMQGTGRIWNDYKCDGFLGKYIFPFGMLPTMLELSQAMEGLLDWRYFEDKTENFSKTFQAWIENLRRNRKDHDSLGFKIMEEYLIRTKAAYDARAAFFWQMTMTKTKVKKEKWFAG